MTNNENANISFEEVWKSLEEQDKTGIYKRAREMAYIAVEQLEYAYNIGYETAEAKYARPQGEWIIDKEHTKNPLLWYKCILCGVYHSPTNFCPCCGAEMRKGNEKE